MLRYRSKKDALKPQPPYLARYGLVSITIVNYKLAHVEMIAYSGN